MSSIASLSSTLSQYSRLPNQSAEATQQIIEKIHSIEALQIDLIGNTIVERIVDNLGPESKQYVQREAMKKRSDLGPPVSYMDKQCSTFVKDAGESGLKFHFSLLHPITAKLRQVFSNSNEFLEKGIVFEITDEKSLVGEIKECADRAGLHVTQRDIPTEYQLLLILNQKQSIEGSKLVFTLVETSGRSVFRHIAFTIGQLEEEMQKAFSSWQPLKK